VRPVDSVPFASAPSPPRLLDQVRARIRVKHYSIRTEDTYVDWIKRFVLHFGKRPPRELGARHVEAFLSDLAVTRRVAASTQNQAKAALLFLYREVLEVELPWLEGITQARTPQRLPVVLTRAEAQAGWLGCVARTGWWQGCSMARDCGCWRRCACG